MNYQNRRKTPSLQSEDVEGVDEVANKFIASTKTIIAIFGTLMWAVLT
jgi:hypothetical protein